VHINERRKDGISHTHGRLYNRHHEEEALKQALAATLRRGLRGARRDEENRAQGGVFSFRNARTIGTRSGSGPSLASRKQGE